MSDRQTTRSDTVGWPSSVSGALDRPATLTILCDRSIAILKTISHLCYRMLGLATTASLVRQPAKPNLLSLADIDSIIILYLRNQLRPDTRPEQLALHSTSSTSISLS